MVDLTSIAYTVLGLTSVASAVRLGHWLLNAPPRAVINAGRWSLFVLAAAGVALLIWLMVNGRWTVALMLAAFLLPLLVPSALQWRRHLVRVRAWSGRLFGDRAGWFPDTAPPAPPFAAPVPTDPDLVRQSVGVLMAYLDEIRRREAATPAELSAGDGTGAISAPARMSRAQALDVLGLADDASPAEIDAACRHLLGKLRPELGATSYLVRTIAEARDVLLGNRQSPGTCNGHDDAEPDGGRRE